MKTLYTLAYPVLSRSDAGLSGETWVVRGWQPEMKDWFSRAGAQLKDVEDLDLEESFVELLSGARAATVEAR